MRLSRSVALPCAGDARLSAPSPSNPPGDLDAVDSASHRLGSFHVAPHVALETRVSQWEHGPGAARKGVWDELW